MIDYFLNEIRFDTAIPIRSVYNLHLLQLTIFHLYPQIKFILMGFPLSTWGFPKDSHFEAHFEKICQVRETR